MIVRLGLVLSLFVVGCGTDDGGGRPDAGGGSDGGGVALPGEPIDETPVGDAAAATIGPGGGRITSRDGRLTLVFPAGALAADTAIEIVEVALPGGRGWILRPEGLAPAVPIEATVTLTEAEAGMATRETVDADEVVTLPVPYFVHLSRGTAELASLEVTPSWREADGALDYAFALPHFSIVAYLSVGEQSLGKRASIPVGQSFGASLTQTAMPASTRLLFRCGEMLRSASFDVAFFLGFGRLSDNTQVQPAGSEGFSFDNRTYTVDLRCASEGTDTFAITAPLYPALADRTVPMLAGCRLAEHPTIRRELTVECLPRVCTATDPVDMSATADGDPSVDVVCVTTGTTTGGRTWIRVVFQGPWPPSSEHYSWFSRIRAFGAAGELGLYTIEHHAGVDREIIEGMFRSAGGEIPYQRDEANGYFLILQSALSGMVTSFVVDSGIQKGATAPFVPDTVMPVPFDATVRDP